MRVRFVAVAFAVCSACLRLPNRSRQRSSILMPCVPRPRARSKCCSSRASAGSLLLRAPRSDRRQKAGHPCRKAIPPLSLSVSCSIEA